DRDRVQERNGVGQGRQTAGQGRLHQRRHAGGWHQRVEAGRSAVGQRQALNQASLSAGRGAVFFPLRNEGRSAANARATRRGAVLLRIVRSREHPPVLAHRPLRKRRGGWIQL